MIDRKAFNEKQWLIVIAIAGVLINYYFPLALFPLTDLDEGAYSGVTREMFMRGDWLSTYLNGEPWYEKPILMYWMQSIGVAFFGVNEWGFRLPSAVASSIWFYWIYRFCCKEYDELVAIFAVIITSMAIGTAFIYKAAIPDPFLTLFITIVLFDIYRFYLCAAEKDDSQLQPKVLIIRAFIFMGLGVLAKGPVAVVIPTAVAGIFFLLQGKLLTLIKAAFNPMGWLLLLLIILPWHIYQYIHYGEAFINDYFLKHNVGRFATSLDGHAGNFLYYVVSIFLLSFPFWRWIVAGLKSGFVSLKTHKIEPLTSFLMIWFLVVIGFFTMASTKLPHYLMYGMAPIFILAASKVKTHLPSRWGLLIAGITFSILILSLPFLLEYIAPIQPEPFYKDALISATDAIDFWFVALLLVCILACMILSVIKIHHYKKIALLGLLVSAQLSFLLMPLILNYQQKPLKEAAFYAIENDIYPVMWGMNMPSFSVYAKRIVPKRKPEVGEWVITETNQLEKIQPVVVGFEKGGISLVKVE